MDSQRLSSNSNQKPFLLQKTLMDVHLNMLHLKFGSRIRIIPVKLTYIALV